MNFHEITVDESSAEFDVFGSQGNGLRNPKIMDLKAPCHDTVGVWRLIPDKTALPSLGKNGSGLSHALGVVPEGPMKNGCFTDRPVDQVSLFLIGILQRCYVSFNRSSSFGR